MKQQLNKILLLIFVLTACSFIAHAQQKASDRPFTTELQKIKEKQGARKKMLTKTQQDGASNTNAAPTQAQLSKPAGQQPARKASTQPMSIPARQKKQ